MFVVCEPGDECVVAYYAWCMAQITVDDAPVRVRRGAGLLRDVILRLLGIDESIGCRGLLIHAESEAAREFYLHLIPGLETSRTDDLHLVVFMKDARKMLAGLPYVRPTPGHVPGRACP